MQAQFKKSGIAVSEVKDHIVASRQIEESTIEKIDGEESTNELLPNDIHPYDHYLVRAIVKFG
jgi:phosphatidylserine decarboxylase